jgi:hypothetical protein
VSFEKRGSGGEETDVWRSGALEPFYTIERVAVLKRYPSTPKGAFISRVYVSMFTRLSFRVSVT